MASCGKRRYIGHSQFGGNRRQGVDRVTEDRAAGFGQRTGLLERGEDPARFRVALLGGV
jgi:hypothetical protein